MPKKYHFSPKLKYQFIVRCGIIYNAPLNTFPFTKHTFSFRDYLIYSILNYKRTDKEKVRKEMN